MREDKVIVEQVIIKESIGPWLRSLFWGGIIGYGIAMLMAPRRGEETRQILNERTSELREQAMHVVEDYRSRAEQAVSSARESLESSAQGQTRQRARGQSVAGAGQGTQVSGPQGEMVDRGTEGTKEELKREENIMNDANTRTYDL